MIALALLAGLVIGAAILAAGVEALFGKREALSTVVVALVSLLIYPCCRACSRCSTTTCASLKEGFDLEMLSQQVAAAAPA